MLTKHKIIISFMALFALFACRENKGRDKIKAAIAEWTGKEIKFPSNAQCCILGRDTITTPCTELFQKEYKILLYVDSTGCNKCKLMLDLWKQVMAEADSLFQGRIGFLFFFQPKSKREMTYIFKMNGFDYPVFIDENDSIGHLNGFPDNQEFQCFLLDKNNKVLALGNPALNPKIWDLYRQQITGGNTVEKCVLTTAEPNKTRFDFGNVPVGSKNNTAFELKNTGTNPLLVQTVKTLCGCIRADWDKHPVNQGQSAKIMIETTPDETGYFSKTITVYCNTKDSPLELTVTGIAGKNLN